MTRVLITGVRGKTGAPLAQQLAATPDVEVLGGSSRPDQRPSSGVRPVLFSWNDPAGWPGAVDGVDAMYLVRPDIDPAPELIADLVDVVAASTRITLLSERRADLFADDHWARRVEDTVTSSGRPWTILRPSWFMQVFTDTRFYAGDLSDGLLRFPGGDALVSWIDARDIAAVAAQALLDDRYDGHVLELSGPESLTLPQTADTLGAALGHDVRYENQSVEDAVAGMTGFDLRQATETFDRLLAGEFADVTDTVAEVTGRPASRLADLVG